MLLINSFGFKSNKDIQSNAYAGRALGIFFSMSAEAVATEMCHSNTYVWIRVACSYDYKEFQYPVLIQEEFQYPVLIQEEFQYPVLIQESIYISKGG